MIPEGFDLAGYRVILESALEGGYQFHFFDEIGRERAIRSCLLRHDIDSELLGCEPLLDVERELGVRATYFLMTRSTAYNLFCVEARAMVGRILADGHQIGLHFMGELCEGESAGRVAEKIEREAEWLRQEFGQQIVAFAFHQPSSSILELDLALPNLVNTYDRRQMDGYFYVSDTNMVWRYEHPLEIFSKAIYKKLQLLIHPMWWVHGNRPTKERWLAVLQENRRAVIDHWRARERTLKDVDLFAAPTGTAVVGIT